MKQWSKMLLGKGKAQASPIQVIQPMTAASHLPQQETQQPTEQQQLQQQQQQLQSIAPAQQSGLRQQQVDMLHSQSLYLDPDGLEDDSIEDEFRRGMQDVREMREKYEGLLTIASVTQQKSCELADSLHELASYVEHTFGKMQEGDIGPVFVQVAAAQEAIARLFNTFGEHVGETIVEPTESLLAELAQVEQTKEHYEEKRLAYGQMVQVAKAKRQEGGAPAPEEMGTYGAFEDNEWGLGKEEMAAKEEFDEVAMTLGCRILNLEQQRPRRLLTQALRYLTAKRRLFRRGSQKLLEVDPLMHHLIQHLNMSERQILQELTRGDGLEEEEKAEGVQVDASYHPDADFVDAGTPPGAFEAGSEAGSFAPTAPPHVYSMKAPEAATASQHNPPNSAGVGLVASSAKGLTLLSAAAKARTPADTSQKPFVSFSAPLGPSALAAAAAQVAAAVPHTLVGGGLAAHQGGVNLVAHVLPTSPSELAQANKPQLSRPPSSLRPQSTVGAPSSTSAVLLKAPAPLGGGDAAAAPQGPAAAGVLPKANSTAGTAMGLLTMSGPIPSSQPLVTSRTKAPVPLFSIHMSGPLPSPSAVEKEQMQSRLAQSSTATPSDQKGQGQAQGQGPTPGVPQLLSRSLTPGAHDLQEMNVQGQQQPGSGAKMQSPQAGGTEQQKHSLWTHFGFSKDSSGSSAKPIISISGPIVLGGTGDTDAGFPAQSGTEAGSNGKSLETSPDQSHVAQASGRTPSFSFRDPDARVAEPTLGLIDVDSTVASWQAARRGAVSGPIPQGGGSPGLLAGGLGSGAYASWLGKQPSLGQGKASQDMSVEPLYKSGPISSEAYRLVAHGSSPPRVQELHKLPPPPLPSASSGAGSAGAGGSKLSSAAALLQGHGKAPIGDLKGATKGEQKGAPLADAPGGKPAGVPGLKQNTAASLPKEAMKVGPGASVGLKQGAEPATVTAGQPMMNQQTGLALPQSDVQPGVSHPAAGVHSVYQQPGPSPGTSGSQTLKGPPGLSPLSASVLRQQQQQAGLQQVLQKQQQQQLAQQQQLQMQQGAQQPPLNTAGAMQPPHQQRQQQQQQVQGWTSQQPQQQQQQQIAQLSPVFSQTQGFAQYGSSVAGPGSGAVSGAPAAIHARNMLGRMGHGVSRNPSVPTIYSEGSEEGDSVSSFADSPSISSMDSPRPLFPDDAPTIRPANAQEAGLFSRAVMNPVRSPSAAAAAQLHPLPPASSSRSRVSTQNRILTS